MNFKRLLFLSALLLCFSSCTEKESAEKISDDVAKNKAKIEALFDDSPGEALFKKNCITCHSLRYIDMQPAFPRKTWEKLVDKMTKTFGAPIPDSSAKAIVDYLMVIKGRG